MRCLLNFKRIDLFANCFLYFALHFPVLSQTEATTKLLSFHLNEKLTYFLQNIQELAPYRFLLSSALSFEIRF